MPALQSLRTIANAPRSPSSLDLYLEHPPGTVLEADALEDVGCGIYPCFYRREGGKLQVSSSVASLIRASGVFRPNPWFLPPFLEPLPSAPSPWRPRRLLRRLRGVPEPDPRARWYGTRESMDLRIFRLRPGERVTPDDASMVAVPSPDLKDLGEILELGAQHFQDFISRVEERRPDHHHLVLVGGRDSQMILLARKRNPERWHVFSAEPNFPLVRRWLEWNDVPFGRLYRHDNVNEETREEWEKKIVASDLYSDPHHLRWLPTLSRIRDEFDRRIILWAGTSADAIFAHHPPFHGEGWQEWFRLHMTRVASWQGNSHQTCGNFLGVPLLSPYHAPRLWSDVLFRHDPDAMQGDRRADFGRRVFGRDVKWLDENPFPKPYAGVHRGDPRAVYIQHVTAGLERG